MEICWIYLLCLNGWKELLEAMLVDTLRPTGSNNSKKLLGVRSPSFWYFGEANDSLPRGFCCVLCTVHPFGDSPIPWQGGQHSCPTVASKVIDGG